MSTRQPPRLLVKTMAVTFLAIAVLLVVVLIVVMVSVRDQVRESVRTTLDSSQHVFMALEARRRRDLRDQVGALAENPTLKAASDTYQAEVRTGSDRTRTQLLATMSRELEKLAGRIECDAIVLIDPDRRVLAAVGPAAAGRWRQGQALTLAAARDASGDTFDGVVHEGASVFRALAVPLLTTDDVAIGSLFVMTILDRRQAEELSVLARTPAAIVSGGRVVASTLPDAVAREFELTLSAAAEREGMVTLGGESYAFRRLVEVGDTTFYGMESIDASSRAPLRVAMLSLGLLAVGAVALGFVASFWLARMVSEPIGRLSRSLAEMAASHTVDARLPATDSSRELNALAGTFNALMQSVVDAEMQTQSAYAGAIRALAAALDARDPYTAGHSDRVSVLSVAIGRSLGLAAEDLEVIRLGALLHDIGKIGVTDEVLRKPGALTTAEWEAIRQHPLLGARILRQVPFLAPHIPIVELHHERPDGRGYPYGLSGDAIPLAARIVHVADAFDAITSARAYRRTRSADDAVRELIRGSGTEFQTEIVVALAKVLPAVTFEEERSPLEAVRG